MNYRKNAERVPPEVQDRPFLVIEWTRNSDPKRGWEWFADYFLSLPLDDLDIRNEALLTGRQKVKMGRTKCGADDAWTPVLPDGSVQTPFRDGAHLKWDAHRLSLPAYVRCGDAWTRVEPEPSPDILKTPNLHTPSPGKEGR